MALNRPPGRSAKLPVGVFGIRYLFHFDLQFAQGEECASILGIELDGALNGRLRLLRFFGGPIKLSQREFRRRRLRSASYCLLKDLLGSGRVVLPDFDFRQHDGRFQVRRRLPQSLLEESDRIGSFAGIEFRCCQRVGGFGVPGESAEDALQPIGGVCQEILIFCCFQQLGELYLRFGVSGIQFRGLPQSGCGGGIVSRAEVREAKLVLWFSVFGHGDRRIAKFQDRPVIVLFGDLFESAFQVPLL